MRETRWLIRHSRCQRVRAASALATVPKLERALTEDTQLLYVHCDLQLLVYTAIVTPAVCSFYWMAAECVSVPTLPFDVMVDCFFLLDIVVSFNSGACCVCVCVYV